MADRVIKAALLGLGTVGGGVYKALKMQEEEPMIPLTGSHSLHPVRFQDG